MLMCSASTATSTTEKASRLESSRQIKVRPIRIVAGRKTELVFCAFIRKKKWSKGKVKDKANNAVIFDKATYDRILKVSFARLMD